MSDIPSPDIPQTLGHVHLQLEGIHKSCSTEPWVALRSLIRQTQMSLGYMGEDLKNSYIYRASTHVNDVKEAIGAMIEFAKKNNSSSGLSDTFLGVQEMFGSAADQIEESLKFEGGCQRGGQTTSPKACSAPNL